MAGQNEVLQRFGSVAGPVELKPISNDPITCHAVEDAKIIYQAIGKSAGLNVLFDPDFQSKRIPVDLTNVSLLDALRIVGTLAGAFYKPVTPDTIFVAQNNRTKHTDLDELAIQTFYLTNAIAPERRERSGDGAAQPAGPEHQGLSGVEPERDCDAGHAG